MDSIDNKLEEWISLEVKRVFETFKDKDQIEHYFERDIKEGSDLILQISEYLKNIATKNKEIYQIYKKTQENVNSISNKGWKEIENVIKKEGE
jgi:hypothetical protein